MPAPSWAKVEKPLIEGQRTVSLKMKEPGGCPLRAL